MKKNSKTIISDRQLFIEALGDVKPLPDRQRSRVNKIHSETVAKQQIRVVSDKLGPTNQSSVGKTPKQMTAQINAQTGNTPGIDKRTAKRLRKGQLKIEATLDLHGMDQAEAKRKLTEFIENACYNGKRCLLIITGKGSISLGGGVLRKMTPEWLDSSPNRGRIIAFTEATIADGGSGALYVLLKRKRR
ncbi:MAG: Smr/MutS family protein [Pseudomonadota bacterium]|nr:Smr/MutS family protein [Pseudomonadota bacterium]